MELFCSYITATNFYVVRTDCFGSWRSIENYGISDFIKLFSHGMIYITYWALPQEIPSDIISHVSATKISGRRHLLNEIRPITMYITIKTNTIFIKNTVINLSIRKSHVVLSH